MAIYSVRVDFTLERTMQIEANSAAEAEAMILGASSDEITHIQGKSYADVKDTVRNVVSVTEVVG